MSALRSVLIIHTDGNTFNNPTLKCVVDMLLSHGVAVDIRYPASAAPMPQTSGVTPLPYERIHQKVKGLIFNRLCSRRLARLSVLYERLFLYKQYDLVIAVDRLGLIEAGLLFEATGTPFVFFSFEIMFESETSAPFKALEREAARHVRRWFVQDESRAACLQEENGLDPATRTLLPVASEGSGTTGGERLRDRLGIPPEMKVALAMGHLSGWSMTREIVASAASWPNDWVLIVHERYGRTAGTLEALCLDPASIPADRVYLSGHAAALVDEMGEILAGVAAGLAFYRPDYTSSYTGRNLECLGLSSGKIATFLRYGVPVVMNEIGPYADLAREHGFGAVVRDPSEIGAALPLLAEPARADNARRFFSERLDFSNYRNMVWEKLLDAAHTD